MKTELYKQILDFYYDTTPTRYVDCDIFVYDSILDFDFNLECNASSLPYYDGPYVVDPQLYDQTLPTQNKSMSADVLVKEVPVEITENPNGGYTISVMS